MDFDGQDCQAIKTRFNKHIPVQDWKKKTKVLIMQHSAVTNFNDRQQNRETWMQSLKVKRVVNNLAFVLDFLQVTPQCNIIKLSYAFRIILTYEQYSLLADQLKMNAKSTRS